MTVLQQDLGNSEAVQKDFVRLSQSLQVRIESVLPSTMETKHFHIFFPPYSQMELEKIRAADTAVRWQDDDDVDNCPSCKSVFSVTRRKVNTA